MSNELKSKIVQITSKQNDFLESKGLSFSKWVRIKLDEEMKE